MKEVGYDVIPLDYRQNGNMLLSDEQINGRAQKQPHWWKQNFYFCSVASQS